MGYFNSIDLTVVITIFSSFTLLIPLFTFVISLINKPRGSTEFEITNEKGIKKLFKLNKSKPEEFIQLLSLIQKEEKHNHN